MKKYILDFVKIKNFCSLKGTIKKTLRKQQYILWENIHNTYVTQIT